MNDVGILRLDLLCCCKMWLFDIWNL